jgi:alanine racemase
MEGIFTHFAVADGGDDESLAYTHRQYERFWQFYQRLKEEGVTFSVCHCCNSAGVLAYGDFYCDMVRPGIVQYGYNPSAAVKDSEFIPRPVMSLRCCITHIKQIDAGETVSYGRHFKASRPTVIATLPLGYADGYPRLLSNRAEVLIKGQRVRQVGNICMDQCMIDVTDVPDVQVGDECVLFGCQGNEYIDLEELAALIGTIDHEILCNINRRVPRVYVKGGALVGRTEYLFNK